MAQLTVTNILQLARKKLLEESEAIIEDSTLLLYANLAKDEIAKRMYTNDRLLSVVLSFAGGIATKPADFESHYSSKDSNVIGKGNTYKWVNLEDFKAGKFDYMLTAQGSNILAYPTNTTTLYMDYYSTVADMVTGGACALDSALHLAVVYKTLALAFQDLQDFELSKHFEEKFEMEFAIKGQGISYSEESSQQDGELFNPISII